ncbi:hypothetical protein Airi01_049170 [Actinoallomurus iriomotensis]|uniref:Uncharacterized protein n=1 Tax=Actinoallomurus iriomotensis TaxID=478107 RepID=A0A9W6RKJ5_9ACTN|nr:hypothetical protein Airi01_049170 [Actinoallomurus iriomotensis]
MRGLSAARPGMFGELDAVGARSVLRRYSDAWFATAARRKGGDVAARFPRRNRGLMPVRCYHGTFTLEGRRLRLPVGRRCARLWVRLDRPVLYPAGQVRSVTLVAEGGRLFVDVTAEVPITSYPVGQEPDPVRVAGVDPGVIHPFAGRAGWGGISGVGAGDPCRDPPASARREGPAACGGGTGTETGQAGSRRWRKRTAPPRCRTVPA